MVRDDFYTVDRSLPEYVANKSTYAGNMTNSDGESQVPEGYTVPIEDSPVIGTLHGPEVAKIGLGLLAAYILLRRVL